MISKYINFRNKNDVDYSELNLPAESIRNGNLVLFPTETVYGIGANALEACACVKIFEAKGREQDNPLIVHVSDKDMLNKIVSDVGEIEQKLIDNFWPGPLTIIFKKSLAIPMTVTAGLDTVAVRMPKNNIAKKLIEFAGVPVAAPSANVSGRPSGTVIGDIREELDGKVEYIIDGGAVEIGLESTVVKVEGNTVHILRPGKITEEELEELNLNVEIQKQVLGKCEENEVVMSPGMKYKHYAPRMKCILIYSEDEEKLEDEINRLIQERNKNVLVLAKNKNLEKYHAREKIGIGDTLEEIGRKIFTTLRKVDEYEVDLVIIEGVKPKGLGLAIMNRLIRACENNYVEI